MDTAPFTPPPFDPVPLRARHDGWTPQRQRAFIAALAAGVGIAEAADAVGRSVRTAYRLRGRPDAAAFRAAWDAALAMADEPPPHVQRRYETILERWHRALNGCVTERFDGVTRVRREGPDLRTFFALCRDTQGVRNRLARLNTSAAVAPDGAAS